MQAGQFAGPVIVDIRLRYLSGITNAMRINENGKIYHIRSIMDTDDRHRELVIIATEGNVSG